MTQYEHHVQEEEDTDDMIEDPNVEGQVQDLLQYTAQKEYMKTGLVVAYALPVEVVDDSISSLLEKQS